jgi:hypothetical protein
MRKIVKEIAPAPPREIIVENIRMRGKIAQLEKENERLLAKRDTEALEEDYFLRRWAARSKAARQTVAEGIVRRIRESATIATAPAAIDDDAATALVASILDGSAPGSENLSQSERLAMAVRRLRAALSGGDLPAGSDQPHKHGGPPLGCALPG